MAMNNYEADRERWSSDRVLEMTMNKIRSTEAGAKAVRTHRSVFRRIAVAAAAVMLMAAISVTALAATGVIDLGGFYNSIFNNAKADEYIVSGSDITYENHSADLKIEPLKAMYDSDNLYISAKVTSLNGTPLPDEFTFGASDTGIEGYAKCAERIDDYTAVVNLVFLSMPWAQVKEENGSVTVGLDTAYAYPEDSYEAISSIGSGAVDSAVGIPENATVWNGEWNITLKLGKQVSPKELTAAADGKELKAVVNGTSVSFVSSESSYEVTGGDPQDAGLTLTLSDGTVVSGLSEFASVAFIDGVLTETVSIPFVNPAEVVAVTYNGVTYR